MANGELAHGAYPPGTATREDIHRLRNEVTRLAGELATKIAVVDHTVTRLEAVQQQSLTPIQLSANAQEVVHLRDEVKELKSSVDAMRKRVYSAVGALSVLAPVMTVVAERALRG